MEKDCERKVSRLRACTEIGRFSIQYAAGPFNPINSSHRVVAEDMAAVVEPEMAAITVVVVVVEMVMVIASSSGNDLSGRGRK